MEILSKKIKIPNRRIKVDEVKHAFNVWEEPSDKFVSIFYKKDDKYLLDDKWDAIILFLEEQLAGSNFLDFVNELVVFTKGVKSFHFFFVDKEIPKNEYFKHSLSSFKKNYYRANEEAKVIKNTFRIDFKKKIFGNSSFWSVEQYEGLIKRSKITWNMRNESIILPAKFSNKNSNSVINLKRVFCHLYLQKSINKTISIAKYYNLLYSLAQHGNYGLGEDSLDSLHLHNLVSGELYTLKSSVDKMSEDTKTFFDNLVVADGIFSESRGVNFITSESGENYFVTLS